MADRPNHLERYASEHEGVFQEWRRRQRERARGEGHPANEFEGVEEAIRGLEGYNNPPRFSPPNAVSTFALGLGDAFPPIRAALDSKVYGSGEPQMRQLSHEMMWARMNHPLAYYAGMGLGLAPGAVAPRFGIPWAAYVLGTDPGVQRAAREGWRGLTGGRDGVN